MKFSSLTVLTGLLRYIFLFVMTFSVSSAMVQGWLFFFFLFFSLSFISKLND